MKRWVTWGATVALAVAAGAVGQVGVASADTAHCQATGFSRDGMDLTAAQIGGSVTGALDATGCDIGVYDPTSVSGATISGARYFGIVVDSGSVDVTDSTVSDIGNTPFDGAQHGIGVYYTGSASGTISGNSVSRYQKGGIVLSGAGVTASVTDNIVTGLGPVGFIAQNGIEVYGATATQLSGNTVTGNLYTEGAAKGYVSSGILLYDAAGLDRNAVGTVARTNQLSGNQADVFYVAG